MLRSKPWLVSENLLITPNNIRCDLLSSINYTFYCSPGTQNNNGQSVFDCVPAEGIIPAGQCYISVLSHIKIIIKIMFHTVSLCVQLFKIIFGKVSFRFIGGSKEITVTFSPDHQSDFYSDGARIELFNQV